MSEHYKNMKIEPYDVMRAEGCLKEYLKGAAIKYIMRAGKKYDEGITQEQAAVYDLEKAKDTLHTLIMEIEKEIEVPF